MTPFCLVYCFYYYSATEGHTISDDSVGDLGRKYVVPIANWIVCPWLFLPLFQNNCHWPLILSVCNGLLHLDSCVCQGIVSLRNARISVLSSFLVEPWWYTYLESLTVQTHIKLTRPTDQYVKIKTILNYFSLIYNIYVCTYWGCTESHFQS